MKLFVKVWMKTGPGFPPVVKFHLPRTRINHLCFLGFEMPFSGGSRTRLEQALLRCSEHTNTCTGVVQMREKSNLYLWLNLLIYRKWLEDRNRTKKMLPTSQMYHLLRKTRLVYRTWCLLRKSISTAHNNTQFLVTTTLPILEYKMDLVQAHVSFISLFNSLQPQRSLQVCPKLPWCNRDQCSEFPHDDTCF